MSSKPKKSNWIVYGLAFVVCGIIFLRVVDPPKPAVSPASREQAQEPKPNADPVPPSAPTPTEAPTMAAASERPPTKTEALALLNDLRTMVKVGEEMARNRYDGEPSEASQGQLQGQRRCVDLMNANKPKLDELAARAARMPESVDALKRMARSLPGCLYCRPMADEGCKVAHESLRDGEREVRAAKW